MRGVGFACSLALFTAGEAAAQQQPPGPPAPPAYVLSLPGPQMLKVQAGLMKIPYEDAAPILMEMQKQMQAQTDAWGKDHPPPNPEVKKE